MIKLKKEISKQPSLLTCITRYHSQNEKFISTACDKLDFRVQYFNYVQGNDNEKHKPGNNV